jgi:hypothetical protein
MHSLLRRTFGGLSARYYFREFFFGVLIAALMFSSMTSHGHSMPIKMLSLLIINTLLYPYSRFVYQGIAGFIMGENVFFLNALFMLLMKIVTMMICWACSILIAPVGLAYLYFHNRDVLQA